MKKQWLILGLLIVRAVSVNPQQVCAQQIEPAELAARHRNLMPVPASIRFQSGRLPIDAAFRVAVDGFKDARLEAGINRAARRLEGRTGFEFSRALSADLSTATLVIQCGGPGAATPSVK